MAQKKNVRKPVVSTPNTQRLDAQVSELMASRMAPATIAIEALEITKLEEYNRLLARDDSKYPAEEVYNGNWDTLHVDPFGAAKIDFPDSYTIDCGSFVPPIDNNIRVTSKYGPRRRRMHRGIDLKLQTGDTVRAAFNGKVRIKSYEKRGYGYYIVLRHPNGLETVYGHLSKFLVNPNQIVRAGEPIALGGNTGRSTSSHLHFETRFLGRDINPAEIIDFENGVPHKDTYLFTNVKINGKKSNLYSTSPNAIAYHKVRRGESLSVIARKYGTTVNELCKLNGIKTTSILTVGQAIQYRAKQVTVEASTQSVKQTPSTDAPSASGKKIEVAVEQTNDDGRIYHSIQSGETLFNIAQKYNTTVEKLCELNNFQNNIILTVGKKIRCS
jgi:murein DD-endopeptidase MepM/ murein hydrolase activator NlpD